MPVRIYTTNAGADLSDAEAALLADLIARHGRAVLLAPTFAELDLCRHDAAEAGVSLGIDYKTPTSWLRSLWELLGDGRGFVDNLQRQMLFSDMVARLDDADLQPLSRSQGTVRMLARMARDVLPGVAGTGAERCCDNVCKPKPRSDAEARVFELCAPMRAVWTVEIWSSPARRLTLWPALWPTTCRGAPAPFACAASRHLRIACSSCCPPWQTTGRGCRAACPRASGDARGACRGI